MEKVACQHDQNHQPQPQFYPPGVADGPGKPFFPQNADDARELAQHQEDVLDRIHRAGINVLWNDIDGGCNGVSDRVPHLHATALNPPGQC
ncbi:hypothetical protein GUA89_27790, partial [Escherichia coli]|nr:hypothetical protein [Escherichia coli]